MSLDTIDAEKTYRQRDGFAVREIAGETLLMPVRSNGTGPDSILILNPTGSVIWRALESPSRLDDIVAAVAAEFDVARDEARADVEAFLKTLGGAGLIREA